MDWLFSCLLCGVQTLCQLCFWRDVVDCAKLTFESFGMTCRVNTKWNRGHRNHELHCEGLRNLRWFLDVFPPMNGLKQLDALKMRALLGIIGRKAHNTLQGRAQIIDLKLSLHKQGTESAAHDAHSAKRTLSRRQLEQHKGFGADASIDAAQDEISLAHKQYEAQKAVVYFSIEITSNQPALYYVSGWIEGDGCLTFVLRLRNGKCFPRVIARLHLCTEDGGQRLLHVFAAVFEDNLTKTSKQQTERLWNYSTYRRITLEQLFTHLQSYPVQKAEANVECLKLVVDHWDACISVRGSTGISCDLAKHITTKIYEATPAIRRKRPLLQVLREVVSWYEWHDWRAHSCSQFRAHVCLTLWHLPFAKFISLFMAILLDMIEESSAFFCWIIQSACTKQVIRLKVIALGWIYCVCVCKISSLLCCIWLCCIWLCFHTQQSQMQQSRYHNLLRTDARMHWTQNTNHASDAQQMSRCMHLLQQCNASLHAFASA